jgi:hypothetical protein
MGRALRTLFFLGIAGCAWVASAGAQVQRASLRPGEVLAWPDRHLNEAVELVGELEAVRLIPGGLELTLSNRRRWHADAPPEARFRVRLADPVDPGPFVVGRLFRVSAVVRAVETSEAVPLVLEGRSVEALDPMAGAGPRVPPPSSYLPPSESRPGVVFYPYPVYVPIRPAPPWRRHPPHRPIPAAPADPAPPHARPRDPAGPAGPAAGTPPAAPARPPQPEMALPGPASPPAPPPAPGTRRPRWIKPEVAGHGGPTAARPPSASSADKEKQ